MKFIKRLIPNSAKKTIRNYQEKKRKDVLFGELAPLVPPVNCMFDGPQSLEAFKANGEEYLRIYQEMCNLQPHEKMLDVGSGIGRKTLPLLHFFNEQAQYEGIDITKAGVDWCQKKFTPKAPNFNFQHIDVYNKHYNPQGKIQSFKYKFPFDDESFSFVMLGSVFTHMLPSDIEQYLSQIYRVLKKDGGRCLISYFLLNQESLPLIETGQSTLDFKYPIKQYRVVSTKTPEIAIAFDQNWVTDMYQRIGFEIKEINYGSWCGRENYLTYQDLILAVKRN